jgi:hypothetical protein
MSIELRRRRLVVLTALLAAGPRVTVARDTGDPVARPTAAQWLDDVMATKGLSGPVTLQRFFEPIFYLVEPFTWTPNPDNGTQFSP